MPLLLVVLLVIVLYTWYVNSVIRPSALAQGEATATPQEVLVLRERISKLEGDLNTLNTINCEQMSVVDSVANERLAGQLTELEGENNRLREDLALFERLAKGDADKSGFSIARMQVSNDSANNNRYNYEVVVSRSGNQRNNQFHGRLQFVVKTQATEEASSVQTISIPAAGASDAAKFDVNFKYFEKLSGQFDLPANAKAESIEARLLEGNVVRASKKVNL